MVERIEFIHHPDTVETAGRPLSPRSAERLRRPVAKYWLLQATLIKADRFVWNYTR